MAPQTCFIHGPDATPKQRLGSRGRGCLVGEEAVDVKRPPCSPEAASEVLRQMLFPRTYNEFKTFSSGFT